MVNRAEISSSTNALGLPDVDSPEDQNPNNDGGGNPNSPSDNAVNGDGTGAPGSSSASTDEDNADPALIDVKQTYDLALTKVLTSVGPFVPGDNVTFTISVFNQGTLDATNIQISDYIPSGMTLSDPNWTVAGGIATMNSPIAIILKGGTAAVDITLRIEQNYQGPTLVNRAEISSSTNALGLPDVDSPEDQNPNNDGGGNPNSPSDNAVNGDGTGAPGSSSASTDEDNADPALIDVKQTYDLALTKVLSSAGPFVPGDNVTFTISVFNQGTLDATNIQVSDYIPTGMTLNDANWTSAGGIATLNTPIASILKGGSTTVDITLRINQSYQGPTLINRAEISSSANALGLPDVDSPEDQNPNNDGGGNPNSPSDNAVNGDGTGAPGSSSASTDEDNADPALIDVKQTYDLALTKVLSSAGPFVPGDNVTFTISVFNQGTLDATNIQVSDYIPTGMTLNDANWTEIGGVATLNSTIASILKGGSTTVDITLTIDQSYQGPTLINRAEISSSTNALGLPDVDSPEDQNPNNDGGGNPNSPSDNAVNGDGTGAPGSSSASTDEDNADPALIDVKQTYDLALTKVLTSVGPFVPGDNVTFTISVFNQGTLDATNIQVSDYIPTGMTLNDANWTDIGGVATLNTTIASLLKGGSTTVDITLTIDQSYQGPTLINRAEISSSTNALGLPDVDSPEDQNPNNDGGGNPNSPSDDAVNGDGTGAPGSSSASTDEDNADPALIDVKQTYDLALTKVLTSVGPFVPGDNVTFTISLFNQGTLDATSIQVSDYIPTGMTLNDANWTSAGGIATLNTPIASILKGGSTTVDITLTINQSYQGPTLINRAEISSSTNALGLPDVDSPEDQNPNNDGGGNPNSPSDNAVNGDGTGAPGSSSASTDEDNADPALIDVKQTFDLALTKVVVGSGPFKPGDNVTFTINVFNQGTLDATNISVIDYIPNGMSLNDANWIQTGNTASLVTPVPFLAKGATTSVNIVLNINNNFAGNSLVNAAEISNASNALNLPDVDSQSDTINGNDAGGNPNSGSDDSVNGDGTGTPGDSNGNTDEDDEDPAQIDVCYTVLAFTHIDVNCFGDNSGSASVSVTFGFPAYTYLWSNGSTSNSISNVVSGVYIVTVSDTKGCTQTGSVTIMQPNAPLVASCSGTAVSCKNGNDGSTSVTATGGTAPYTYLWSNGVTTASNSNVVAGTYTATVTDANGCSGTCDYTVTEPTQLVALMQRHSGIM
nr:DUF11 domain-containing protein [Bacteroidota bacterium]